MTTKKWLSQCSQISEWKIKNNEKITERPHCCNFFNNRSFQCKAISTWISDVKRSTFPKDIDSQSYLVNF